MRTGARKPVTGLRPSFAFERPGESCSHESLHAGALMPIASSRRIASASKWP